MKAKFNYSGASGIEAPDVGSIFSNFGETLRQNRLADELLKRQEKEDAWKAEERDYLLKQRKEADELEKKKQQFITGMLEGPKEISGGITNAINAPRYQNIINGMSLTPEEQDKKDFETYLKLKKTPFEQLSKSQQNLVSKYDSLSPAELQSKMNNPLSFDEQLSIEKKLGEQQDFAKFLTNNYTPQYESKSEQVARNAKVFGGATPDFIYKEIKDAETADITATTNLRDTLKTNIAAVLDEKSKLEKELAKFETTHNADGTTKTKSSSGTSSKKDTNYADFTIDTVNKLDTWGVPETLIPFVSDDIERFVAAMDEWQRNKKDVKYIKQAMQEFTKPGNLAELNLPDTVTTQVILKRALELEKESKSGSYGKGDNSYTKVLKDQIKELDAKSKKYSSDMAALGQGRSNGRNIPLQLGVDKYMGNQKNRDIAFNNRIVVGPNGNRYFYDTEEAAAEARDEFDLAKKLTGDKTTDSKDKTTDSKTTSLEKILEDGKDKPLSEEALLTALKEYPQGGMLDGGNYRVTSAKAGNTVARGTGKTGTGKTFTLDDGTTITRDLSKTLTDQFNNPGAVKYADPKDTSKKWKGQVGVDDQGHAIFDSKENGARAQAVNTYNQIKNNKNLTLEDYIKKYATGNRKEYTDFITGMTGIKPNDILLTSSVLPLVNAQAAFEGNGYSEEILQKGYDLARKDGKIKTSKVNEMSDKEYLEYKKQSEKEGIGVAPKVDLKDAITVDSTRADDNFIKRGSFFDDLLNLPFEGVSKLRNTGYDLYDYLTSDKGKQAIKAGIYTAASGPAVLTDILTSPYTVMKQLTNLGAGNEAGPGGFIMGDKMYNHADKELEKAGVTSKKDRDAIILATNFLTGGLGGVERKVAQQLANEARAAHIAQLTKNWKQFDLNQGRTGVVTVMDALQKKKVNKEEWDTVIDLVKNIKNSKDRSMDRETYNWLKSEVFRLSKETGYKIPDNLFRF